MDDERQVISNPPPTYQQAEEGSSDAELPPSYDSLYGKVKAAKATSSGNVDFFKRFVIIVLGTIGCTIMIGFVLAIPVSMIVMGSVFFKDCPREHYIPIYLIVGGCFGVIKNLSNLVQSLKNKRENNEEQNAKTNPFDGVLNCFLLAWFIAGNVWIYRIYKDYDTQPGSDRYCNNDFYLYAFWLTTATYIVLAVSCCCFCTVGCLCTFGNFLAGAND